MLRSFLYRYPEVLGLLKIMLYKLAFGADLAVKKLPSWSFHSNIRIRHGGKLSFAGKCYASDWVELRVTQGGRLHIGNKVCIGQHSLITCRHSIEIQDNVMLGPSVTIYDHDHDFARYGHINDNEYKLGAVVIEEDAWIGCNVTILKGVRIGARSVVAAGSVVTRDVAPDSIFFNRRIPESIHIKR